MSTIVKLCGMSRPEDIEAALRVRPDYVGFIVDFPKSHRSVSVNQLLRLCQQLDDGQAGSDEALRISKVAVFVDKPAAQVAKIAQQANLNCVQLHGSESDAYIDELRALLPGECTIIKAFRIRSVEDAARAEASRADVVLLDSGQGSGQQFDWSLVKHVARPFLLAGGLTPENVTQAIEEVHPWGVDMSSGIETNKVKDPAKMKKAVEEVRRMEDKERFS